MSDRTLSPDELAAIRRRLAALGKGELELVHAALGADIPLESVLGTEIRYLVSVLDRWERGARNSRRVRAIP